jgi:hypothetical protein
MMITTHYFLDIKWVCLVVQKLIFPNQFAILRRIHHVHTNIR